MTSTAGYLRGSRLFRRLRSGIHGHLVELYAARLVEVGLSRHGTWRSLNVVGNLLAWMASRRTRLSDLDERVVERYLRQQGAKQSIQLDDRAALLLFLTRLGLCSCEIVRLTLDDIDWDQAQLRVRGKGERESLLP